MPEKSPQSPLDFNDDGTPKVPILLWIAIFYLSRHLLLVTMGGLNALQGLKRGRDIGASFDIVSRLSSDPLFLVASIPAFLVLIALILRSHTKNRVIRTLLTNGRWLAASSALVGISLSVFLWQSGQVQPNQLSLLSALLDFYAAWYLLRSPRAITLFSYHRSLTL